MSETDHQYRIERRRFLKLLEACQALNSSLVLDEVIELITSEVLEAFDLTGVDIYEYRPARDDMIAIWSYQRSDPEAAKRYIGQVIPLDADPAYRSIFTRGTVVEYQCDDPTLADRDPETFAAMNDWGEKTVIETGLLFGDKIVGVLSVGSTGRRVELDDDDKELLIAFAAAAAIAMHNAMLHRTIEEQAVRDGLTGLYNHRHFYERLAAELLRSRRYAAPLALLLLDIDDFKAFNDRFGHRAGDAVLRAVARTMAGGLRADVDLACRYGGEEFAVLLPNTPPAGAEGSAVEVAERLRRGVEALHLRDDDGNDLGCVTVSVGVAVYPSAQSGSPESAEDLVHAADRELYAAKASGKNRVCCAEVEVVRV